MGRALPAATLLTLLLGATVFADAPASATPPRRDALAILADWSWPTSAPIVVENPFRAPETPYAAGHRGVDLRAATGEPVTAVARGVVSFSGMVAGRPVVSIDHGGGLVSSVEPVVGNVVEGEEVLEGDPLGSVASGGHCDARCVHLGVRLHGEYVSPMLYLGGVPWAVLLPD
ncbi:Peptidase family M23 [Agromyces sp. CF514]|uniref:murein hydrolase activator EnvC family protein n=1 Tax=Agromyces sp. CF514 TaxID=1881031 RepID=UPI0008E32E1D|nr:M23 family metallopeptidase [Agromyces sp. CF514]SFR75593.1 Peptidase family M23 [Agromyces sp. CF514]